MKTITQLEAAKRIKASGGQVFNVKFRKRTGQRELRTMRARTGVKKGLAGGPPAYDPDSKGLIWVYRMAGDQSESEGQRRSIPIEGMIELTIGGQTFKVVRDGN